MISPFGLVLILINIRTLLVKSMTAQGASASRYAGVAPSVSPTLVVLSFGLLNILSLV